MQKSGESVSMEGEENSRDLWVSETRKTLTTHERKASCCARSKGTWGGSTYKLERTVEQQSTVISGIWEFMLGKLNDMREKPMGIGELKMYK